jgi:glycosyltransferase involved in cell wall biosynthesis
MPAFSLILATLGRSEELHRLFASLDDATSDYECIVVDQNADDRLQPVLAAWEGRVPLRCIKSTPGLSRARNAGLEVATGDFLAFPDDDCWYSPGLLRRVLSFFTLNLEYGLLSVGVRDADEVPSGNRWVTDSCDLGTINLFRTSVGMALFVRREGAAKSLRFDESLGVGAGTPFASGEDTDYVFRALAAGIRGRFDRRLTIYHPRRDMLSGGANAVRAYSYGCGMGRVIRKQAKAGLVPAFVTYDFLRMAYSLMRGQRGPASLCAAHGRGVLAGYQAHE